MYKILDKFKYPTSRQQGRKNKKDQRDSPSKANASRTPNTSTTKRAITLASQRRISTKKKDPEMRLTAPGHNFFIRNRHHKSAPAASIP